MPVAESRLAAWLQPRGVAAAERAGELQERLMDEWAERWTWALRAIAEGMTPDGMDGKGLRSPQLGPEDGKRDRKGIGAGRGIEGDCSSDRRGRVR